MKQLIPVVLRGCRQMSLNKLFSHTLILSLICNSNIYPVVAEKIHKFSICRSGLDLVLVIASWSLKNRENIYFPFT